MQSDRLEDGDDYDSDDNDDDYGDDRHYHHEDHEDDNHEGQVTQAAFCTLEEPLSKRAAGPMITMIMTM